MKAVERIVRPSWNAVVVWEDDVPPTVFLQITDTTLSPKTRHLPRRGNPQGVDESVDGDG